MMGENQKLPENHENKLLRYDANTRQVEKLNITKKIDSDEVGTIVYLDDRRKRLLKDIKEKNIDYLTNTEIEEAIKSIEAFGLKNLNVDEPPASMKPVGSAVISEPKAEELKTQITKKDTSKDPN